MKFGNYEISRGLEGHLTLVQAIQVFREATSPDMKFVTVRHIIKRNLGDGHYFPPSLVGELIRQWHGDH
jgi:hypothetical protein